MPSSRDEVPALAKPFVVCLVALMLASAIFVWEPWPVSSFRLFSHARTDTQVSWSAQAVTATGERVEYPIPGLEFAMPEFIAIPGDRDDTCREWIEAAPEVIGGTVTELTVSEQRVLLTDREGTRAAEADVTERARCDMEGGELTG